VVSASLSTNIALKGAVRQLGIVVEASGADDRRPRRCAAFNKDSIRDLAVVP
jgi:hypothetical protein